MDLPPKLNFNDGSSAEDSSGPTTERYVLILVVTFSRLSFELFSKILVKITRFSFFITSINPLGR